MREASQCGRPCPEPEPEPSGAWKGLAARGCDNSEQAHTWEKTGIGAFGFAIVGDARPLVAMVARSDAVETAGPVRQLRAEETLRKQHACAEYVRSNRSGSRPVGDLISSDLKAKKA